MQNFKNKLYNYETPPPEEIWDHIEDELENEKILTIPGFRKNKFLFYGATAAASVAIILLGTVFLKKDITSNGTSRATSEKTNQLTPEKIQVSINRNQQILKSIINDPQVKKEIILNNSHLSEATKKYITIANPEGQPVKISPKVATLIISADNEYPPKPVWTKEIRKWQQIMLNNTVSPTSANFIDIIQIAACNDNIE